MKWISGTIGATAAAVTIFEGLHFPVLPGLLLLLGAVGVILLLAGVRLPGIPHFLPYSAITIALAVIIAWIVLLGSPADRAFSCSARVCYSFADGSTQGWDIRTESGVRLGTMVFATDSPHVGLPWQRGSLELIFHIGTPPTDKAQIEVGNVPLTKQVSAWVYVPSNMPQTLELFAFVLEHNTGAQPGKPEWPFYKTQTVTLNTGGWTEATFPVGEFVGVNTNLPWSNPPLLIGFEIHSAQPGEFDGVAYFAHISVT
jgi:hypothetical protein